MRAFIILTLIWSQSQAFVWQAAAAAAANSSGSAASADPLFGFLFGLPLTLTGLWVLRGITKYPESWLGLIPLFFGGSILLLSWG